jgi:uncharacterized membrane protein
MGRLRRLLLISSVSTWFLASSLASLAVLAPETAEARPRSGGSFSGRGGFRSGGGSFSRSRSGTGGPRYNTGPSFIVFPGFGWGLSPFGAGGCGFGGSLMMLALVGMGAVMIVRAVRQAQARRQGGDVSHLYGDDDVEEAPTSRVFVYKVQLGLGRSARGIQERLARFADEGDTSSEAGLAQLLQQTALELLREKESIRYGSAEGSGPYNLANGESKLSGLSLAERSRFQVERVRGADGKVRRSTAAPTTSDEVLEYLMVTVLVATRVQLPRLKSLTDREDLDPVLAELGSVPPRGLLGLEVIWTPADADDALTEADLLLTYPHVRSL